METVCCGITLYKVLLKECHCLLADLKKTMPWAHALKMPLASLEQHGCDTKLQEEHKSNREP